MLKQTALPVVPAGFLARVRLLLMDGRRKILGVVGPPGAGKSTLAVCLQQCFANVSQIVSMDGFHLANGELKRLGMEDRKGAPETFDGAGYAAMLLRLKNQGNNEVIYAPEFRREIEEPIAGAVPILPGTQLVITEGNYLLLNNGHWSGVASLLDDIWYVDVDDSLRSDRLVRRHQRFGRSEGDALAWVTNTDEPNARIIANTQARARVMFRWDEAETHGTSAAGILGLERDD